MKKLTIVGDEKVLKMIQKENQIRFRKFNMISCIEDATEKEIVEEKEEIEERPYINLEKKEPKIKHKK
jgi:hypothetical protein